MVEAGATGVSEEQMLTAIRFGYDACQTICEMLDELQKKVGQKKLQVTAPVRDEATFAKMKTEAWKELRGAILTPGKHAQKAALKEFGAKLIERHAAPLAAGTPEREKREKELKSLYSNVVSERTRAMILEEDLRADGRGLRDVRPIHIALGVLPRVHRTALFTRNETQSLTQVTLGTQSDEQRVDGLRDQFTKRFYLDYNFPPFSVNEVKPIRGPGRREIGHGVLAERALTAVVPNDEKFPYTMRLISDILESNGSSSMASVCAGSLAMMDAGVPITAPVAGIAMGLVTDGSKVKILTDILGGEDHDGDMDFKVAGTADGITAMQMDVKITGLDLAVMKDALAQAREGRLKILSVMNSVIAASRASVSKHAPRILRQVIPIDKIGALIGPGGKNIRMIQERTGTDVEVDDFGKVVVSGKSQESIEEAMRYVSAFTREVSIGDKFEATVVELKDFGAFVELVPGQEALLHVSEMTNQYVQNPRDVVDIGHKINVTVINVDPSGKIKVSARTTPGRPPSGGRDGPRPPRRDDDRGGRFGGGGHGGGHGGGGGGGGGGGRGRPEHGDRRGPDERPRPSDFGPPPGESHGPGPRDDFGPPGQQAGSPGQPAGSPGQQGESGPPRDGGDQPGWGDDAGGGSQGDQGGGGGGGGDAGHFRRRRRR